jgi:membrane carboxypeptidase/penicillin-binding protein PbpC
LQVNAITLAASYSRITPFENCPQIVTAATHRGGERLHGFAFFVNGAPLAPPSSASEVVWTPNEVGEFTLEVRVLDGRDTGTTSMQVGSVAN